MEGFVNSAAVKTCHIMLPRFARFLFVFVRKKQSHEGFSCDRRQFGGEIWIFYFLSMKNSSRQFAPVAKSERHFISVL